MIALTRGSCTFLFFPNLRGRCILTSRGVESRNIFMNEARTKQSRSRVHWRPARTMIKILMWQHNRVLRENDRSPTELERSANFRRIVLGETSSCEQRGTAAIGHFRRFVYVAVYTQTGTTLTYIHVFTTLTYIYIRKGSHKTLSLFSFFIFHLLTSPLRSLHLPFPYLELPMCRL